MAFIFNDGVADNTVTTASYPGIEITGAMTVCFWAKWTSSTTGVILAKWGADQAYLVEMTTANKPQFYIRVAEVNKTSGASASSYLNAGWNHFAGIFDGVNVRLLINAGNSEALTGDATAGPIDNTTDALYLARYSSGGSTFGGYLQDVGIFNRALSGGELLDIMHNSCSGKKGLQLHYPLTSENYPAVKIIRNTPRPSLNLYGIGSGTNGPTLAGPYSPNNPNQPLVWQPTMFNPLRIYGVISTPTVPDMATWYVETSQPGRPIVEIVGY